MAESTSTRIISIGGLQIECGGRGACLFHVVGKSVGRSASELRDMTTKYMLNNSDFFTNFVASNDPSLPQTVHDYAEKMAESTTYAEGHREFVALVAALALIGINIVLFVLGASPMDDVCIINDQESENSKSKQVVVGHNKVAQHFTLVVRTSLDGFKSRNGQLSADRVQTENDVCFDEFQLMVEEKRLCVVRERDHANSSTAAPPNKTVEV